MATFDQTEEQRRRAFQDAGLGDGSSTLEIRGERTGTAIPIPNRNPGAGVDTPLGSSGAITAADMAFTAAPNFKTPTPSEPFPVKDIPIPELPETEPEREASDVTKRLQELNNRLSGQSAFRTEQEKTLGVEGLRKTSLDLSNQLRALQAEAEATRISPEFEQKNVLSPFAEGERGRKLRDVGVRALIVGANLQASQGNLAMALDQVDRAVEQKFGPVKEEIAVKTANLDLILKSPEFSRAEKERAERQKIIQQARLRDIEIQEREQDSIWKTGIEAAQAGADSLTLRKIQNAKSATEAMQLASPFTQKQSVDTQVVDIGGRKVLINSQTGETIRDFGGAVPGGGSPGGITDPSGKPLKLTASQTESLSSYDTTMGAAQSALALLDQGVQTGPVAGRTLQAKKFIGRADSKQLELEQILGKIKADFFKAVSGAAVSEQEVKRLSKFLPDITDQESVIRSKLNTLSNELSRSKSNLLRTLGASEQSLMSIEENELRAAGYTEEQIQEIRNAK